MWRSSLHRSRKRLTVSSFGLPFGSFPATRCLRASRITGLSGLISGSYIRCLRVKQGPPRKIVDLIISDPDFPPQERMGEEGYLVLYRFNKNPSQRFYDIRKQLSLYYSFKSLQRGVLKARGLRGARALVKVITHYGGLSRVFKAQEVEFAEGKTLFL